MSKKIKIILFIVVLLVIAVMVVINLKKAQGDVIEITSTEVKRGDITRTVSGSGKVQPETDVNIAARISAEIIKIHVNEGEQVKKGRLLVELDRERYIAIVEQVESQQNSARASLKKAEADYVRVEDLYEKNLASQADLDAAEATKESAESSLNQAKASLKQARDDLGKTKLISPIDGTVTKIYKEEGEIAVGSQFQADVIMNVADLNHMEVLSEIDENEVILVHLQDKTKVEVDAIQDHMYEGEVTEIAHLATTRGAGTQEQVTNFEVTIGITSNVQRLRPGMSATVDIATETREDVLYVPIQTVTARELPDTTKATTVKDRRRETTQAPEHEWEDPNAPTKKEEGKKNLKEVVFIVVDGVAKMIPVESGISDDNNIEIISGLEEGQRVITGSYKALSKLLKDGSKVKEKKSETAKDESEK
ncbi:efflux RND transporter periplasmic adaptor subunit [candidate division KSB1 bacterium]|nr:efflux RND transporter periplasmic adaptor subunit [candidate division KSB1 bacterium]